MAINIGINGFGRIGRLVLRAASERDDVTVVAINDLLDVDYIAYMLKYDSTHGKFNGTVDVVDGNLVVNGNTVRVSSERDPANIAWGDVGTDVVVESTGIFLTEETAQKHIDAGAKKVVRPHDYRSRNYCNTKNSRWPVCERLAWWARCATKHYSIVDWCSKGCWQSHSCFARKAYRYGI